MDDLIRRIAALPPEKRDHLERLLKRARDREPARQAGTRTSPRAFYLGAGDEAPDPEELRRFLQQKLPAYMVPAEILQLPSFPVLAGGKVDLQALRRMATNEPPANDATQEPRTELEKTLAGIWRDLLRVDHVGNHDNFFSLGGDSILSIQMVSRARRHGIHLDPKQIFQYPTIGRLAAVAGSVDMPFVEQALLTGKAPLTPIQHWFFEQDLSNPHHYNQAVMLRAPAEVDLNALERALDALRTHHDALRLRYNQTSSGWDQRYAEAETGAAMETVELPRLTELEVVPAAEKMQSRMNLAGPVFRAVLFHAPGQDERWLLLVAHHLVVDGVSWRILLEDLASAYEDARRRHPIQLPPKTSSLKAWAERLAQYAQTQALQEESAFWQDQAGVPPLPLDHAAAKERNPSGEAETLVVSLEQDETRALLTEAHHAYHTRVDDLLLTALALTLSIWTKHDRVLLDLEGHGRDHPFPDVDLTRTVGWFTVSYPLVLTPGTDSDPGTALKNIKEQLRAVPRKGLGYGVLRYLAEHLFATGGNVLFNYLGQIDQIGAGSQDFFQPDTMSFGAVQDPRNQRSHLLEINAMVAGGRLHASWTYCPHIHQRDTVEQLGDRFRSHLTHLIQHCLSPEAGGLTPSDVSLTALNQSELNRLQAQWGVLEDLYPLSPMQHGMLYETLLADSPNAYFGQMSCRLVGVLNAAAFKRAWEIVVARHSVLRSGFLWQDLEQPLQGVYPHVDLPWRHEDWSEMSSARQKQPLVTLAAEERARGFDLTKPPLMRWTLIRLDNQCHQWIWSQHHILMDGWTTPIILREVFRIYHALLKGEDHGLPPAPPYREFIAWLAQQDRQRAAAYWREAFRGYEQSAGLVAAVGRSVAQVDEKVARTHRKQFLSCGQSLTKALTRFSRNMGLTMHTLVQASWALLLSRYLGEEDVVFGLTVSGRPADLPDVERMVGLFINTVPVRSCCTGNQGLADWLRTLQANQVARESHGFASLVDIAGWGGLPRDRDWFDTLLVFENYPTHEVHAEGDSSTDTSEGQLVIEDIQTHEHAHLPLTALAIPGSEMDLGLDYDTRKFSTSTVNQLLGHFRNLLQSMVEHPQASLGELTMLSQADQQRLLATWNHSPISPPATTLLHQFFERQVKRVPETVALHLPEPFLGAHGQWNYRCLNRMASLTAQKLRSLGIGNEDVVAVMAERSPVLVATMLGIFKAGGVYLPLDPDQPRQRMARLLANAGARCLVKLTSATDRLPVFSGPVLDLGALETNPPSLESNRDFQTPATRGENAAYLMFTSGSTGRPKGVAVSHAAIGNRVAWARRVFPLGSRARFLQTAAFHFDISVWECLAPLAAGACLVLSPYGARDAVSLWKSLLQLAVTDVHWVPSLLRALLEDDRFYHASGLQRIYCGGETFPPALLAELKSRTKADVHHFYGPTEAAINATAWDCKSWRAGAPLPIGRPIDHALVYVVDARMRPMPPGAAGELCLGGLPLARGYFRQPGATARAFVPNPFAPSNGTRWQPWMTRLYKTGDRVRFLPGGELLFLGREDHQIKLRGFRIEPGEVEAALLSHDTVRQAVVVAHGDGSDAHLVAYVVPENPKHEPPIQAWRKHVREILPDYMAPAQYAVLEALPLKSNGKLDRAALPEPDPHRRSSTAWAPPRDLFELKLRNLWADVLTMPDLGIHDHFFELGGHSLQALRLMARIRREFDQFAPLALLFENPTVASMAARLRDTSSKTENGLLVALQPKGSRPPLFCVHPAGGDVLCYAELARALGSDQPCHGLRSPVLDEEGLPFESIEHAASTYLAALRQVQPEGPYALAGWSFGGLVVFEMARQLQEAGETAASVALIDTYLDGTALKPRSSDAVDRLLRLAREMAGSLELPFMREDLEPLPEATRVDRLLDWARTEGLLPGEVPTAQWQRVWQTFESHARMAAKYKPGPYRGRIDLFFARDQEWEVNEEPARDWSVCAPNSRVSPVAGAHETLLNPPFVEGLARELAALLRQ